jgi:hypothetical protein
MILDHRTYNIKPNRLAKFLETDERLALPLQRKHLGEPYDFFVTHIGSMSRVVHRWQHEDSADRERRRDAMEADPEWRLPARRVGRHARGHGKPDSKTGAVLRPALSERYRRTWEMRCGCAASNEVFTREELLMVEGTTVLPINKEPGMGGSPPGVGAPRRGSPRAALGGRANLFVFAGVVAHTLWTSAAPATRSP